MSFRLKEKIIHLGVVKLKKLGFVNATRDNILGDEVHAFYFHKILTANLGRKKEQEEVIKELLLELEVKHKLDKK